MIPAHVQLPFFGTRDNCLTLSDRTLPEIVATYGGTPLYLYDRELIANRVNEVRAAIPNDILLHYAIKANPLPELVQAFGSLVDGLDVASAGELEIALQTQVPREEISFAGPGKSDVELEAAARAGIIIHAESMFEIERLNRISRDIGVTPKLALRVNPSFELRNSGMRMSGGPKPFGIDSEQVPEVLKRLSTMNIAFFGFHIFSGSQNLNAESIKESQSQTLRLAIELSRDAPSPPRYINFGGGFGIPYFPGDTRLDLAQVGKHLTKIRSEMQQSLPDTNMVIELGRYLVGEAGIYVCEVLERKVSRGEVFLITNGGLHHHLSASGNFGQVIRKNYPVVIGNRLDSEDMEECSIVGPLCTPLDVLGHRMVLPKCQPGDLVVVFQSGAYGYSASPRSFLSHPEPKEILL